jgi:hypothetical protein
LTDFKRGSTFWKCRNRLLVSFMENGIADGQNMASFLLPSPFISKIVGNAG